MKALNLFFVILFLISCSERTSSNHYLIDWDEIEKEKFYLEIGGTSKISSNSHIWNQSFLVNNNTANMNVEFYDLVHNKKIKDIQLESEGPNGVGKGDYSVFYHNTDSLFVSNKAFLYHIDDAGKVIKRYGVQDKKLGNIPNIRISSTNPLKIRNGKLYVSIYPHRSAFKKDHLSEWKNFICIDLTSGDVNTFGSLPEEMKNTIYGYNFLNHSVLFQEDRILTVFSPVDAVFSIKYDDLDMMERHDFSLPDWKVAPKLEDETNEDTFNNLYHFVINQSYDAIYKYEDKIIVIGQEANSEDEYQNRVWAKKKTLFILDEKLNLKNVINTKSRSVSYVNSFQLDGFFHLLDGTDIEDMVMFSKFRINDN